MGRAASSFSLVFLFVSLLGFSSVSWGEPSRNAELEGILRKIESRHYRWIAIRADVLLFFAKDGDPNALCGGKLLYQRLDERLSLACMDVQQKLVFAFRTHDRRFDLYLPAQNTVYHGSIFDMEDSPDIESHLKARDLYRALKPMAVDPRRTKVERTNSAITHLNVYGRNENKAALVRKLYLTPEGDVRGELFYDSHERPVTEIQRYDFRELRSPIGSYNSIIFPKKITIMSPETKKGSAIFFTKVAALDTIDPLEFILRVPPGTKEVFLDEKNSRYQTSKISPKSVTASALSRKKIPVYLAKPRKQPVQKITPPPARKKRKAPKKTPTKTSSETASPQKTDTALSKKDRSPAEPSSASDARTTLDPSVDASLEMER